jgi:hypothetical protein
MRRVVRLTNGMPNRDSINPKWRLTAAVDMPCSRAAALSEPALANAMKKPKSAGLMSFVISLALG